MYLPERGKSNQCMYVILKGAICLKKGIIVELQCKAESQSSRVHQCCLENKKTIEDISLEALLH